MLGLIGKQFLQLGVNGLLLLIGLILVRFGKELGRSLGDDTAFSWRLRFCSNGVHLLARGIVHAFTAGLVLHNGAGISWHGVALVESTFQPLVLIVQGALELFQLNVRRVRREGTQHRKGPRVPGGRPGVADDELKETINTNSTGLTSCIAVHNAGGSIFR